MREVWSARRRTIWAVVVLILVSMLVVGYVLTFHLDTVQRMVQQHMRETFGQALNVSDVQITVFPSPRLTLTNLQILESEDGVPLFQAARLHIDLSIVSIIQDEFVPKGLVLDSPELYLRRNVDGQWNLESFLEGQSVGSMGVGALLTDYTLTIENGVIQVVDAYKHETPEQVELKTVMMEISPLSAIQPMDVLVTATLNRDSHLSLHGTVAHVHDFFSSPPETGISSGPQINVQTHVALSQSDVLHLARLFPVMERVAHHRRIMAQSQIRYEPNVQGDKLLFSDVIVRSDRLHAQGQISIAGFMTAPTISATWASAPIRIQHLLEMVPPHMIPDDMLKALVTQPFDGILEVVSATISGSTRDDRGFRLIGEFRLSEGSLDLGTPWGVAGQIQGTLLVQPDRVQLQNFEGMYDSIPVSLGIGEIEFRESGPWFSTELHGTVPSKKLIDILKIVFGWTDPDHPMTGLVGERGSGSMMIHFAGPLSQPEHIVLEQARYDPEQVTIHIPGLDGPIMDMSGRIIFSQRQVSFESLKGVVGKSPISFQGKINIQDPEPFATVHVTGHVSVQDMATQFGTFSNSLQSMMSGTTNVVATIVGPLDAPHIHTLWNLDDIALNLDGVLHKDKAVKGTLTLDLELEDGGQRLKIDRLMLSLPPLHLSGQASLDRQMKGIVTASVTASSFDLQTLPVGLTIYDGLLPKGAIEFSVTVDGQGDDWRQWKKDGWFALTNGVLTMEKLDHPLSHIVCRVRLNRHVAEIKQLQLHMEESEVRLTGLIKDWETQPVIEFEMRAPQVDIELFIPKGNRSLIRDVLESMAAMQTVGGTIHLARARYKGIMLQDVAGRLQIHNGIIGVDQITGSTESGNVQGRLVIHVPVRQPVTVKTWLNLEDLSLQSVGTTFLSPEDLREHQVTGTLSVQGMVQGRGNDDRGIIPTLNGELTVLVKDGRIRRDTILPKLLALMNLPALLQGKVDLQKDGYPFVRQTGTFTIKNGVMSSKNIILDGPILTLTGAGEYNLVEDQLDLVVAANPLGPYFTLLRNIPLFGSLLDGDEDNIMTALFDVKGSIHDPIVQSLPFESVRTGLTGFAQLAFNVLKNTVALPSNILFPPHSTGTASPPDPQPDEDEEF